ncbi:MAG: DUF1295 domain-containing protein [bacterium]|nr:DUF1295 domain-containing protein [bacterium]
MDLGSFGWALLGAAAFLSIVFILAHKLKRYDLVDSAWGPTFIVVAFVNMILHWPSNFAGKIVFGLVIVWGSRLSYHILPRFIRSDSEDKRYVTLRSKWPKKYLSLQVYARIYLTQAILACLVSLPVMVSIQANNYSTFWLAVGGLVWLVGFWFELTADKQLKDFLAIKNNRGKLMIESLWSYSRHPNYFGELTMWWGLWIVTLGTGNWAVALFGPLLISFLIIFVSGLPPAEARSSQKPGWDKYKSKTSSLLPWPPKK